MEKRAEGGPQNNGPETYSERWGEELPSRVYIVIRGGKKKVFSGAGTKGEMK